MAFFQQSLLDLLEDFTMSYNKCMYKGFVLIMLLHIFFCSSLAGGGVTPCACLEFWRVLIEFDPGSPWFNFLAAFVNPTGLPAASWDS